MGTIFAGLLACAGNQVTVVHRNADDVARINARGLRITGASGDRTATVEAFIRPPDREMDLVVVAVKATQIRGVGDELMSMVGPNTVVLTMQNGLGSAEHLASVVGNDRVAIGIAGGFGASLLEPGHTHHNGMEVVRMGSYAGLEPDAVDAVAACWRAAGFKAEAVKDIRTMQWEKLICNVAYSAPCALTGMTVGQVLEDPELGPVSQAAAREAWEIGRARGIRFSVSDPVAHAQAFAARMPASRPSMLQDHESRRSSEIDYINGAVPREAALAGTRAPVNEMLTALVKAKEKTFAST
jgi:2-dehydropantoate 2-reductase